MGEPFDAIGFSINDEAAYQALAEQAHKHGAVSRVTREKFVLRSHCWTLGNGLEVWTAMHEAKDGLFYVDCRPSFRARRSFRLMPWEIIEYEEEGEAVVRGYVEGGETELLFELQNLTEHGADLFRERMLAAAVAGLAYHVRVIQPADGMQFIPIEKINSRRHVAENDYAVRGQVLHWREISNPQTNSSLFWIDADFGRIKLELLVNRQDLKGQLTKGAWISGEVWLQGHVLSDKELQARYEGIDMEFPPGDYWMMFRREN